MKAVSYHRTLGDYLDIGVSVFYGLLISVLVISGAILIIFGIIKLLSMMMPY